MLLARFSTSRSSRMGQGGETRVVESRVVGEDRRHARSARMVRRSDKLMLAEQPGYWWHSAASSGGPVASGEQLMYTTVPLRRSIYCAFSCTWRENMSNLNDATAGIANNFPLTLCIDICRRPHGHQEALPHIVIQDNLGYLSR